MDSVQDLSDLWKDKVEHVDNTMKESLRTKAQLSEHDIDECYQLFTQDLLQRQSIVPVTNHATKSYHTSNL